jgi:hypothetical protein
MYNYKTVTPYGIFERKSKKLYSHIVVFQGKITEIQVTPKEYQSSRNPEEIHTIHEYCGRYDLALKASNRYKDKRGYVGTVEIFETQY